MDSSFSQAKLLSHLGVFSAPARFLDAAARALLTGRSTLRVTRNQLVNLRKKQEDLRNELASVEQRVVLAESGLGQLEAEFGVANRVLEGLILDENKAASLVKLSSQSTVLYPPETGDSAEPCPGGVFFRDREYPRGGTEAGRRTFG